MTVYGLLASLAWSGVVVYLAVRADQLVRHRITTARQATVERGTSDREGKLERAKLKAENRLEIARLSLPPTVARSTPTSKDIVLPDDLEAYVMQWSDDWARDDVRGNVRAKYLEFHDGDADTTWQKVRASVGIGTLP